MLLCVLLIAVSWVTLHPLWCCWCCAVAGIINCPELIFSLRAPHCEIYERCHRPAVFTINNLLHSSIHDPAAIFTVYPQFLWKLCQLRPLLAASVLAMNGPGRVPGPASTGIHYGVISHAAGCLPWPVDTGVPCTFHLMFVVLCTMDTTDRLIV